MLAAVPWSKPRLDGGDAGDGDMKMLLREVTMLIWRLGMAV